MTYSCARFSRPELDLTTAQDAKHDLICRKLGLSERPGGRLLDVGCGWGSMAIHAATHYDVSVVGITISEEQAALAHERVTESGLTDRIEIRLQDYRDLGGERFDAISSIGMSEHVGHTRLQRYFEILRGVMQPQGRLVNHAIDAVRRPRKRRPTFIDRYVFPDGELIDVADSVAAMEQAGFEVRDVESLREHYARTLRAWVSNLEGSWDEAVRLTGWHGRTSGGSTWPGVPLPSTKATSPSTRCSASCPMRMVRAGCPRRDLPGNPPNRLDASNPLDVSWSCSHERRSHDRPQ